MRNSETREVWGIRKFKNGVGSKLLGRFILGAALVSAGSVVHAQADEVTDDSVADVTLESDDNLSILDSIAVVDAIDEDVDAFMESEYAETLVDTNLAILEEEPVSDKEETVDVEETDTNLDYLENNAVSGIDFSVSGESVSSKLTGDSVAEVVSIRVNQPNVQYQNAVIEYQVSVPSGSRSVINYIKISDFNNNKATYNSSTESYIQSIGSIGSGTSIDIPVVFTSDGDRDNEFTFTLTARLKDGTTGTVLGETTKTINWQLFEWEAPTLKYVASQQGESNGKAVVGKMTEGGSVINRSVLQYRMQFSDDFVERFAKEQANAPSGGSLGSKGATTVQISYDKENFRLVTGAPYTIGMTGNINGVYDTYENGVASSILMKTWVNESRSGYKSVVDVMFVYKGNEKAIPDPQLSIKVVRGDGKEYVGAVTDVAKTWNIRPNNEEGDGQLEIPDIYANIDVRYNQIAKVNLMIESSNVNRAGTGLSGDGLKNGSYSYLSRDERDSNRLNVDLFPTEANPSIRSNVYVRSKSYNKESYFQQVEIVAPVQRSGLVTMDKHAVIVNISDSKNADELKKGILYYINQNNEEVTLGQLSSLMKSYNRNMTYFAYVDNAKVVGIKYENPTPVNHNGMRISLYSESSTNLNKDDYITRYTLDDHGKVEETSLDPNTFYVNVDLKGKALEPGTETIKDVTYRHYANSLAFTQPQTSSQPYIRVDRGGNVRLVGETLTSRGSMNAWINGGKWDVGDDAYVYYAVPSSLKVDNWTTWRSSISDTPDEVEYKDVNGVSYAIYKFRLTEIPKADAPLQVDLNATVNQELAIGQTDGTIIHNVYYGIVFDGETARKSGYYYTGGVDYLDLNNNNNTANTVSSTKKDDVIALGQSSTFRMIAPRALFVYDNSRKDNGVNSLNTTGVRPSTTATITPTLQNATDSTSYNNMTVISTLSRTNDTRLDGTTSRGSEFNLTLTGPVTPPSGWTVQYTTQSVVGKKANAITGWTNSVRDYSQVTALKFVSDSGTTLPPSQVVTFPYQVNVDPNATFSQTAVTTSAVALNGSNVFIEGYRSTVGIEKAATVTVKYVDEKNNPIEFTRSSQTINGTQKVGEPTYVGETYDINSHLYSTLNATDGAIYQLKAEQPNRSSFTGTLKEGNQTVTAVYELKTTTTQETVSNTGNLVVWIVDEEHNELTFRLPNNELFKESKQIRSNVVTSTGLYDVVKSGTKVISKTPVSTTSKNAAYAVSLDDYPYEIKTLDGTRYFRAKVASVSDPLSGTLKDGDTNVVIEYRKIVTETTEIPHKADVRVHYRSALDNSSLRTSNHLLSVTNGAVTTVEQDYVTYPTKQAYGEPRRTTKATNIPYTTVPYRYEEITVDGKQWVRVAKVDGQETGNLTSSDTINVTYYYTPKVTEETETKAITQKQIFKYRLRDGRLVDATHLFADVAKPTLQFTRTKSTNSVTNATTYGEWTPVMTDTFPAIDNKLPDKNEEESRVWYIETLGAYPEQMVIPAQRVTDVTKDEYEVTTILIIASEDKTETKTITRTIKHVDNTGKSLKDDEVQTVTLTRTRSEYVDAATDPESFVMKNNIISGKEPTYTVWTTGSFANYTVPDIANYNKDKTTIASQSVTDSDGNIIETITYTPVLEDGNETKTITRTIKHVDNTGVSLKDDVVQTVTLTRTTSTNKVTNETTYGDWSTETLPMYSTPDITNYNKDKTVIGARNVTNGDSEITETITYTPVVETGTESKTISRTLKFVEQGTNKVLADDVVQSVTFTRPTYTNKVTNVTTYGEWDESSKTYPVHKAPSTIDDKWKIVGEPYTFEDIQVRPTDSNSEESREYIPIVDESEEIKTITRTIKHVDDTNVSLKDDVIQTATLKRNKYYNRVTEKTTYDDWSTDSFESYTTPDITNYNKDKTTIANLAVTSDSENSVETITYSPVIEEGSESKELSRTIQYRSDVGAVVADSITQKVTLTRPTYLNKVSNETTYGEWTTASFDEVTSPPVTNYFTTQSKVDSLNVTADSENVSITVTYYPEMEEKVDTKTVTRTIKYQNTSGETLAPDTVQTATFQRAKIVNKATGTEEIVGDWVSQDNFEHTSVTLDNVTVPTVANYTSTQTSVDGKSVTGNDTDETLIVFYNPTLENGKDIKTVTRTIKYVDEQNKEVAPSVTQTVTYTRPTTTNKVTSDITYGEWTSENSLFDSVLSPTIANRTPDKAVVDRAITTEDSDDMTETVIYLPVIEEGEDKRVVTRIIKHVDNVTKNQVTYDRKDTVVFTRPIYTNKVTNEIMYGEWNETTLSFDTYNTPNIPNYQSLSEFVKGEDVNASSSDKFYTITYFPKVKEDTETRTVTRTIHMVDESGNKLQDDVVQTATFTRSVSTNQVTKEVTYGEWTSDKTTFDEFISPNFMNRQSETLKVDSVEVTPDTVSSEETIVYTPIFTDGTESKTVVRTINFLNPGLEPVRDSETQVILFTRKKKVNTVDGSVTYDEWTTENDTFDKVVVPQVENYDRTQLEVSPLKVTADNDNVVVNVIYQPIIENKVETKTITRLVRFVDSDNNSLFDPVYQTVTYSRIRTTNKAQNVSITSEWETTNPVFDEFVTPEIAGYTTDVTSIDRVVTTANSLDISETVVYTPTSQQTEKKEITRTIRVVDSDGKKLQDDVVQAVTFTRPITFNRSTNQVEHGEWTSVNSLFSRYSLPSIENYEYDNVNSRGNIDRKRVTIDDENEVVTLVYKPQIETTTEIRTITRTIKGKLRLVDGSLIDVKAFSPGVVESHDIQQKTRTNKVTGETTVGWWQPKGTDDDILVGFYAHFQEVPIVDTSISKEEQLAEVGYYADVTKLPEIFVRDPEILNYEDTVIFYIATETVPETKTVTRTIRFVDRDGNELEPSVVQESTFSRSVTGYTEQGKKVAKNVGISPDETLVTDWTATKSQFDSLYTPAIDGYTTTVRLIQSESVNVDSENQEITVVYDKVAQPTEEVTVTRTIKFIDLNGNELAEDVVQDASFIGTYSPTGELVSIEWNRDSVTLDEVISPQIDGYVAYKTSIPAITVTPDSPNLTEIVTYAPVTVDVGTQTDETETTEIGTQTDETETTEIGTQTDEKETTEIGTQTDENETVDIGTQTEEVETTEIGTQTEEVETSEIGTQTEEVETTEIGTQTEETETSEIGTQTDEVETTETGTQTEDEGSRPTDGDNKVLPEKPTEVEEGTSETENPVEEKETSETEQPAEEPVKEENETSEAEQPVEQPVEETDSEEDVEKPTDGENKVLPEKPRKDEREDANLELLSQTPNTDSKPTDGENKVLPEKAVENKSLATNQATTATLPKTGSSNEWLLTAMGTSSALLAGLSLRRKKEDVNED